MFIGQNVGPVSRSRASWRLPFHCNGAQRSRPTLHAKGVATPDLATGAANDLQDIGIQLGWNSADQYATSTVNGVNYEPRFIEEVMTALPEAAALGFHSTAASVGTEVPLDFAQSEALEYTEKELLQELKECACVDDVLDIVEDEADLFTAAAASTAVHRLNTLAKSLPRQAQLALPHHSNIARIVEITGAHAESMKPWQLAQTMHSLVALKVQLNEALLVQFADVCERKAWTYSGKDIATVFRCFARLGVDPGRSVLDKLGFKAQSLMDKNDFEPASVSILVHSCATLGYRNDFLFKAAARIALQDLERYTPQGVANTLWGFAKLNFNSPALCRKASEYVSLRFREFNPQEICNLFWAFGSLRYHPQDTINALLSHSQINVNYYQTADVTSVLHILGLLAYVPESNWSEVFSARAKSLITLFKPMELCTIYWSLAMTEQHEVELFSTISQLLPDMYARDELNDACLRMVFQGFLSSQFHDMDCSFPPVMLDSMKRCWVSQLNNSREPQYQTELVDIMKALKVKHDSQRRTKDGLAVVDLALKPGPERFVALQVLRESDYCGNTGQLTAGAMFRRQLLEQNGWEVRHMRLKEYTVLPLESRAQYVLELLQALGYNKLSLPQGYAVPSGKERVQANRAPSARASWGSSSTSSPHSTSGFKPSDTELIMDVAGKSSPRSSSRRPTGLRRR